MNIQAEKLEIMKMILETDNPTIIESIKRLFVNESSEDFWTELPLEQREEIQIGLEEIKKGDTVNYDDFIKHHKK
jgi:hypothetical protein